MDSLITDIANIALALSFVVALIFGVAQVRAAARDRKDRLTLETINRFQTREFAELLYFINSRDMPKSLEEREKLSPRSQVMFIEYAQQMESLGILVAEQLIDIDLVEKTLGDFVITSFEKYRPVFEDMRVRIPDPYLGEYFQWLAERMDEQMRAKPRQPAHIAR